jgi:TRAP-type C4-dicarboxylate transport system permease small subunit
MIGKANPDLLCLHKEVGVTKILNTVQKVQIALGGGLLFVFLVTVVYQILTRNAGIAATWTEDVSQYSFVWAVFMGASAMIWEQRHFAFTSFSDSLKSPKAKGALAVVINLVILGFCVLMVYYGLKVTRQFWNYTWINLPHLKRGPVWLCIPIAGCMGALYSACHMAAALKSLKE